MPEYKGSLVICYPVILLNQTFAERNQDTPSKGINLSTANETVADKKKYINILKRPNNAASHVATQESYYPQLGF